MTLQKHNRALQATLERLVLRKRSYEGAQTEACQPIQLLGIHDKYRGVDADVLRQEQSTVAIRLTMLSVLLLLLAEEGIEQVVFIGAVCSHGSI